MLYNPYETIATEEAATTDMTKPLVKPAEVDEPKDQASSSPTNSEAKPSYEEAKENKSTLAETLHSLIDMISKLFTNLGGRISALYVRNDDSFLTKYAQAKKNYKPDVPFRKETTRCDTRPADAALALMRTFVQKAINECNQHTFGSKLDDNSIFELKKEEFYKTLLEHMKAPKNITNPTQYFNYLKEVCKGQKGIITITADQLSGYEKVACLKADALLTKIKSDEVLMHKGIAECRTKFRLVSNSNSASKEAVDRAIKYTKRLEEILKIYRNFLMTYNEIKVNKINTARSILNAVYKI